MRSFIAKRVVGTMAAGAALAVRESESAPPSTPPLKGSMMTKDEALGRFGHHPDPAIDFCVEIEELEAIGESERLGLTGFGHEQERETLDQRIERAMDFRVGGDQQAVAAKAGLRSLATSRGFNVHSEAAYAGQPLARTVQS